MNLENRIIYNNERCEDGLYKYWTFNEVIDIVNRNDPDELFELGWINAWDPIRGPYGGSTDLDNEYIFLNFIYRSVPTWYDNYSDIMKLMIKKYPDIISIDIESFKYSNYPTPRVRLEFRGNTYYYKMVFPKSSSKFSIKFYRMISSIIRTDYVTKFIQLPRVQFKSLYPIFDKMLDRGIFPMEVLESLNIEKLMSFNALNDVRFTYEDLLTLSNLDSKYSSIIRSNINELARWRIESPDIELIDIIKVIIEVENEFGE